MAGVTVIISNAGTWCPSIVGTSCCDMTACRTMDNWTAKAFGASAVLLICAILNDEELKSYRILAEELGMDALVEAHDEGEVRRALTCGAKIIGVNNRNLHTFEVDTGNSIRLRKMAPEEVVFVSESGIRTPEDIKVLADNQVDAVLIGETLMRSSDKKEMLAYLNRDLG